MITCPKLSYRGEIYSSTFRRRSFVIILFLILKTIATLFGLNAPETINFIKKNYSNTYRKKNYNTTINNKLPLISTLILIAKILLKVTSKNLYLFQSTRRPEIH